MPSAASHVISSFSCHQQLLMSSHSTQHKLRFSSLSAQPTNRTHLTMRKKRFVPITTGISQHGAVPTGRLQSRRKQDRM
jgi:hypothetical protein